MAVKVPVVISTTKIWTWTSKRFKRFSCEHDYHKVDETFGDQILQLGYRSLWKCSHCDHHRKSWRLDELVL